MLIILKAILVLIAGLLLILFGVYGLQHDYNRIAMIVVIVLGISGWARVAIAW